MITSVVLAAYAILAGVALPRLLVRAMWPHRAPAVAILAWQGLMATFVIASAAAVYHLVLTERHVHEGVMGLLSACGLTGQALSDAAGPSVGAALVLGLPGAVMLVPACWLAWCGWQARRVRGRQLSLLGLVGEHNAEYGATVVDHETAAVYCVPGRRARIVVTTRALKALSRAELRAVLEHERAHIAGRHHLPRIAADAFARAFPWLPLARHARVETELLLEMAADDRALRFHPREALARAMYRIAMTRVPAGTLGAGGTGAVIRLKRMLAPSPRPHRATRLGVAAAALTMPLLPLLLACGS